MKLGRKGPNLEEEGIIDLVDDGRRHLFDDPRNVKRGIMGFFGFCLIVLLLDILFFFEHKHLSIPGGQFELEGIFGFYGIYCCLCAACPLGEIRIERARDAKRGLL